MGVPIVDSVSVAKSTSHLEFSIRSLGNELALELDQKLQSLDPSRARYLESLVRDALERAEKDPVADESTWPSNYFKDTAGALAGEAFERPEQGELRDREIG